MTAPTQDQQDDSAPITRLAGMPASQPLARRLVATDPPGLMRLSRVPSLAVFVTEAVELDFIGERNVPQMRIDGRLERVVPLDPEAMPYAIGEIGMSGGGRVPVHAGYRFTTEQLQELVGKGLYVEGFGPPQDWVGIPMEMPCELDIAVIPPVEDGEPPIVTVDIAELSVLDMSRDRSGYDFSADMPDYLATLAASGLDVEGDQLDTMVEFEEFAPGAPSPEAGLGALRPDRRMSADAAEMTAALEGLTGRRLTGADRVRALELTALDPETSRRAAALRAGLNSVEDSEAARALSDSLAQHSVQAARATGSDADLLDALGDDADLDSLGDLEGLDLDLLDFGDELETTDAAVGDGGSAATSAADVGAMLEQEVSPEISDSELESMSEEDLADGPGDSPQEKARKQALRVRLMMMRRARAARRAREAEAARLDGLTELIESEPAEPAPGTDDGFELG